MEGNFSFKDLLVRILRHWRIIIIFAIIFGLLLGGIKFFKEFSIRSSPDKLMNAQQEYDIEVITYEQSKKSLETQIESVEKKIEAVEDYLDHSLVMKMDPYSISTANLVFYVNSGYQIQPNMHYQTPDKVFPIAYSYNNYIKSADMLNAIDSALNFGVDLEYLRELITVSMDNANTGIIQVDVKCLSVSDAEKISNTIESKLLEYQPQVESIMGTHSISVVGRSLGPNADLTVLDRQVAKKSEQSSLITSLPKLRSDLQALKSPEVPTFSFRSIALGVMKYCILGAAIGILCVCAFLLIYILLANHLYEAKDLSRRYKSAVIISEYKGNISGVH